MNAVTTSHFTPKSNSRISSLLRKPATGDLGATAFTGGLPPLRHGRGQVHVFGLQLQRNGQSIGRKMDQSPTERERLRAGFILYTAGYVSVALFSSVAKLAPTGRGRSIAFASRRGSRRRGPTRRPIAMRARPCERIGPLHAARPRTYRSGRRSPAWAG